MITSLEHAGTVKEKLTEVLYKATVIFDEESNAIVIVGGDKDKTVMAFTIGAAIELGERMSALCRYATNK